jgi:hypothetical protein
MTISDSATHGPKPARPSARSDDGYWQGTLAQ